MSVTVASPKGKVVVVTGATSGLGQASAVDLAGRGARVIVVGRDAARADETLARVKSAGGEGDVVLGDVSVRAGARAVAEGILAKTDRVDVLLNNAGGTFDAMSTTADGVETTFALNTLGAFMLERGLHAALATAHGRVVNVSTGFLQRTTLDVDDLVAPKKYSGLGQYSRAKLASIMLTVEQSRRFEAEGITAVSVHPGIIMGTRFGGGQPAVVQAIGGFFMRGIGLATTLEGAAERFRIACFGDVTSGVYMIKGEPATLPVQAGDPTVRSRLYQLLEKLAG